MTTGKSLKGILWEIPGGKPGWSERSVVIPSAGSGEVARYANQEGHEVYVADLNCAKGSLPNRIENGFSLFYERTSQKKPDFFMLTGMTCKADNNARFAEYLKARNPNIPIIMGGTHISGIRGGIEMAALEGVYDEGAIYALDRLAKAGVDFLYAGESINIGELLTFISEGKLGRNLEKIKGVSYREHGKWVHNQKHADATLEVSREVAFKESPMWERYLFGFAKTHLWGMGPAFPFRISKGCDYNCDFCSAKTVNPNKSLKIHIRHTPLDFEHSLSEFENLLRMGAEFIFFTDEDPLQKDSSGYSHGRKFLKEITRRGLAKNVKLGMMTSGRATADKEEVAIMKDANVVMAMTGYESLTNPKGVGKTGFNPEEGFQSIENLADAGIMNLDGAIVGGFDDDKDSIINELTLRAKLGLGVTLVQPLEPYFGTETRIKAIEEKLIRNNGRENNGYGGFGGMHGEMIASLATRKGLEPLDVTEAIVSALRRNQRQILKNVFTGPYLKHVPTHLVSRAIRFIPQIPEAIKESRMSDRELAEKRIKEVIEYNQLDFEITK